MPYSTLDLIALQPTYGYQVKGFGLGIGLRMGRPQSIYIYRYGAGVDNLLRPSKVSTSLVSLLLLSQPYVELFGPLIGPVTYAKTMFLQGIIGSGEDNHGHTP
jgi:hypothetical protein